MFLPLRKPTNKCFHAAIAPSDTTFGSKHGPGSRQQLLLCPLFPLDLPPPPYTSPLPRHHELIQTKLGNVVWNGHQANKGEPMQRSKGNGRAPSTPNLQLARTAKSFHGKQRLWKSGTLRTCSWPLPRSKVMSAHRYPCAANEIIPLGLARRGGGEGRPLKCRVPWPHGGAVEANSLILLIRAISIKSRRVGRPMPVSGKAGFRSASPERKGKKEREAEVEGFPY